MPNTRKKVIKTVYVDEDDSEAERAAGDFSDSGSEAHISEQSSSEEDEVQSDASSGVDFHNDKLKQNSKTKPLRKTKFTKRIINKIQKQMSGSGENEQDFTPPLFSIKDLSEADKLLPPVLNLSESDSSDDDSPSSSLPRKKNIFQIQIQSDVDQEKGKESCVDTEANIEYKDVWSNNIEDNSEEVAKKTFMELEWHKSKIEETKESILKYSSKPEVEGITDVKDLLAQGEENVLSPIKLEKNIRKKKKAKSDSESDKEDWEEVKEAKGIPQQGLQLIVDIPDTVSRKTKKIDIEMMMKRKINRVKKEHQIYMHKVHILCWIGHGNYVSRVLNDQEVLAAALSLVPSKECYPSERVDMKYVEQITTWFKDKLTLKQDKNEDKYKPKAPPLKNILLGQIKNKVVTTKKYFVFIFVSMLRALGLQCRVMFNFVTLPIRPPSSELCSLSTKPKDSKANDKGEKSHTEKPKKKSGESKCKSKGRISQVDGIDDNLSSDCEYRNILQLDGNDDHQNIKTKNVRSTRAKKNNIVNDIENDDVSPPKRARKSPSPNLQNSKPKIVDTEPNLPHKRKRVTRKNESESELSTDNQSDKFEKQSIMGSKNNLTKSENLFIKKNIKDNLSPSKSKIDKIAHSTQLKSQKDVIKKSLKDKNSKALSPSPPKTRKMTTKITDSTQSKSLKEVESKQSVSHNRNQVPEIIVTKEEHSNTSKYFDNKEISRIKKLTLGRRRSQTANPNMSKDSKVIGKQQATNTKSRTRSAPGNTVEKSKYFSGSNQTEENKDNKHSVNRTLKQNKKQELLEDTKRVSHRDLISKTKTKPKNDVTADLVSIIKTRVRESKEETKKLIVKRKNKQESEDDSDFLPEETTKKTESDSEEEFKPTKISPKPSVSRKIDRRVLTSDEDTPKNKIDVWCEIFVEELEQWISVDVIKGKVHCTEGIYTHATHPMCYVVGWDNNNYLKDLTRRYVPHWNTVTRKQRTDPVWWQTALRPWLGPKTAHDREEDEQLNRLQLEAPLPTSIAEYKNHPLYALRRHLLKFEAIYPPDAAILGFVRKEPVYARDCVYVCRSRDIWLKEAKVVRLGEQPYKVVKSRPKWDRLSNKLITDKPLEIFGPWQVQDYEPPVAENGIVPRNAYGNVELFKDCMLPKGTVHIKLPGLNKVAKKLNIDCAPAMIGFDFNGGWSHPVYDGFVVCKEFEEIITEAWVKDQEEQERREREKLESRVYGNWKRLIKGLLIRERLKLKYGFEKPSTSTQNQKKGKGPRLVVKK